jgi:hypothetical protein
MHFWEFLGMHGHRREGAVTDKELKLQCMTANRKPTDAPMSERNSAYEERFSFSVNFSVTVANRS